MSKGYAAFNVKHLRRRDCGGSTRGDRARLLNESMRELDSKNLAYQAQRNPNIVKSDAGKNIAFVNDGAGGVRRAVSVDEVLDYQDKRMDGVRVRQDSFETSMFAVHLPKSMCTEIPDYYSSMVDGERVTRPRLVARDDAEAERYLVEAMFWLADNYIPGGRDVIAGGDINFDESTPHIQFQADTLSPDPKDPGKLRCAPGLAYNTHKDVRYVDGPKAGQQISGHEKMRAAQRGLREHMHALGYPVELEVSERHDESLSLDRYTATEDARRAVQQREKNVEGREKNAACLEADAERDGFARGYSAGRKKGEVDVQADRDAAREELERARQARLDADAARERAVQAQRQAEVMQKRVRAQLEEAREVLSNVKQDYGKFTQVDFEYFRGRLNTDPVFKDEVEAHRKDRRKGYFYKTVHERQRDEDAINLSVDEYAQKYPSTPPGAGRGAQPRQGQGEHKHGFEF